MPEDASAVMFLGLWGFSGFSTLDPTVIGSFIPNLGSEHWWSIGSPSLSKIIEWLFLRIPCSNGPPIAVLVLLLFQGLTGWEPCKIPTFHFFWFILNNRRSLFAELPEDALPRVLIIDWTLRYRARLILSKCYSPDLSQSFGAQPRNPWF